MNNNINEKDSSKNQKQGDNRREQSPKSSDQRTGMNFDNGGQFKSGEGQKNNQHKNQDKRESGSKDSTRDQNI